MRIAVIGATGKAGKLIVQEAVNRSHEVTAISRRPHPNTPAQHTLVKNVTDLTTTDFKAVDVVISALGSQQIVELTTHLGQILSGTDTRLVVIGGTGTLYTTPARTERLLIPRIFRPNIESMLRLMPRLPLLCAVSLV